MRAQDIGKLLQHLISARVTKMVVDLLEVIEVEHQHGQAGHKIVFAIFAEQGTAIEDASEVVRIGRVAVEAGSTRIVQRERGGADAGYPHQNGDGIYALRKVLRGSIQDPLLLEQQDQGAGEKR